MINNFFDFTEVDRIQATIRRHVQRENKMSRVLPGLRIWFEQRLAYLNEELRIAVDRADNIIGKQGHYDSHRGRLRLRYYNEEGRKVIRAAGFKIELGTEGEWREG